ncbi:response regulator [bacterium]|nr:response regulator [bacterium]
MNMMLAADLLELAGYDVLQARSAEIGMRIAREEKPDLILMDVQLPGMDGLTATRALADDAETAAIPVVALTSHAMRGDEQKALDAGCKGYIAKPIDANTFAKVVTGHVKRTRLWT